MKYLTSIELLRRVSKTLQIGKRALPPMSQLKSMKVILSHVLVEVVSDTSLLPVAQFVQSMREAVGQLEEASALNVKTQMTETLINNDFEACKGLSKKLPKLDMKRFNEYYSLKDRSRLINLIDSTVVIDEIPENMQIILQKGVGTVIGHFCDVAYKYYSSHDFDPTPPVVDTMREVVKEFYCGQI